MKTRIIAYGVLAVSATALGGVYLFMGQDGSSADSEVSALYAKAQEQDFRTPAYEPMEVQEVEQRLPEDKSESSQRGGRGDRGDFAARMTQFDLDGDGFLSKEERDAMREAFQAERLARFDLDGDGEVSREERRAARQDRFENSDRGQALMRQFDANGDGVLDDEEQAALDAHNEEQRAARDAERIAQYDLDGDGELSAEERQIQRDEQRAQWETMRADATAEFDVDGDGQLNIDEQQNAMDAWMERRAIDRFVSQFDTNGDSVVNSSDYDTFAADYGNGDHAADVNGDGVVNTDDLGAYRDLVTRSGNRP